jgi:hypothetical protein
VEESRSAFRSCRMSRRRSTMPMGERRPGVRLD